VGITGHLPTHLVLHVVLVLVLVPLLLLKILIARRYKHSHSSLKALGITIFVISFVLVSIPTLSELLRSANPGSLGLRLATGVVVAVCLVQCALVFKKRKQPRASVESSGIPEIPARLIPLTDRENAKSPMHLLRHSPWNSDTGRRLYFARLEPNPSGPQNINIQGGCLKMSLHAS
jgi:hypothetical protein